jgi:hypothetical protein
MNGHLQDRFSLPDHITVIMVLLSLGGIHLAIIEYMDGSMKP